MSKPLSHRRSNGQCRECGRLELFTAPKTCCRCSLEIMAEADHLVVMDPVAEFSRGWELWRQPAADMRHGLVQSDRFHLYVGHNDGGSLVQPPNDVTPGGRQFATRPDAVRFSDELKSRYPQVWVVTTVGSWNAYPQSRRAGEPGD